MSAALLMEKIRALPDIGPKVCQQCSCDYFPKYEWQDDIEEFCSRSCQHAFNFEHSPMKFYGAGKRTFQAEIKRYKGT